jgi:hypothetical protein
MGTINQNACTLCPLFKEGIADGVANLARADMHFPVYIGKDDYGWDFQAFGETSGSYFLWDASADQLKLVGTGRTISGEEHFIDVTYTGTCSSTDAMVALNIDVTTGGVNAGWISGIFANVTEGSTKRVDGYYSAGEFQITTACATSSAATCLVLDWINTSGTATSNQGYIMLRDYGSTRARSLFVFGSEWASLIGSDNDTASLLAANVCTASTHTIRFVINAVPYFIMCSNTLA